MTIKIIKRGKIPQEVYEHKCSRCSTEFEFEKEDIEYDNQERCEYIECPHCKQTLYFGCGIEPFRKKVLLTE